MGKNIQKSTTKNKNRKYKRLLFNWWRQLLQQPIQTNPKCPIHSSCRIKISPLAKHDKRESAYMLSTHAKEKNGCENFAQGRTISDSRLQIHTTLWLCAQKTVVPCRQKTKRKRKKLSRESVTRTATLNRLKTKKKKNKKTKKKLYKMYNQPSFGRKTQINLNTYIQNEKKKMMKQQTNKKGLSECIRNPPLIISVSDSVMSEWVCVCMQERERGRDRWQKWGYVHGT